MDGWPSRGGNNQGRSAVQHLHPTSRTPVEGPMPAPARLKIPSNVSARCLACRQQQGMWGGRAGAVASLPVPAGCGARSAAQAAALPFPCPNICSAQNLSMCPCCLPAACSLSASLPRPQTPQPTPSPAIPGTQHTQHYHHHPTPRIPHPPLAFCRRRLLLEPFEDGVLVLAVDLHLLEERKLDGIPLTQERLYLRQAGWLLAPKLQHRQEGESTEG